MFRSEACLPDRLKAMGRGTGEGATAAADSLEGPMRESPRPRSSGARKHRMMAARASAIPLVSLFVVCAYAVDIPATTLLPVVPGDAASGSAPFIAWHQDVSNSGYVEQD